MQLNENYKLESDSLNITLSERRVISGKGRGRKATKPIGEEYYVPIAYYSTVKDALEGVVRREIRGTGLKDLETVVAKVQELHTMIEQIPEIDNAKV